MLAIEVKFLFINVPIEGAVNCLVKRLSEFYYSDVEARNLLN